MSVNFYNPGDQAIYDSGLSFIPQSQFRLGDPRMLTAGGITNTEAAANMLAPPMPFIPPMDRGGDGFMDDDDDEIDRSNNAGINSFSDFTGAISIPGMIGGVIGGIPGAILGRTLGSAFNNFNNQYTDVFGRLNRDTLGAINRDQVRDLQNRIDRGEFDGPTGPKGIPDRNRGTIGTRGSGGTSSSSSSSSAGFDQGERGGRDGR